MKRLTTRVVVITVGLALFFAAGTGAAWAYWTATTSGNGGTSGDGFPGTGAAKPSVSVVGTTVTLSFNRVTTTGSRAASAYAITRYDSAGSNPQVVASPSCSIGATVTCTITGVPLGTWRYSYRPQLGTNWQGAESAFSDQSFVGATKLVYTSVAVNGAASATASLGPITIQQQDASSTPITATSSVTVSLSSNSAGTAIFGTTSGASSGVTSVTIPSGSSSATFFYGDTKAASPTITATSPGLTSATQAETVSAGSPSQIAFTAAPTSGAASATPTIGAFTVEQEDQFGNRATAATARTLNLSTTATATGKFSATSGGSTTTSVSIAANSSSASFYYGDTKAGSPTISVVTTGWASISKSLVVKGAAPASLALAGCLVNSLSVACSSPFSVGSNGTLTAFVQAFDQWGNTATISSPVGLSVSSQSSANYTVTSGGSLTIDGTGSPANQTTASFTVTKNGTANNSTTITVSAGGTPADLTFTVKK